MLAHDDRYDGTVRNAVGDVIQFLYGEDGMDGAAIESQKLDALKATEVCLVPSTIFLQ